ncbi:hypothetical protein LTR15_008883 [Elasticomyces elasticus]|nr:hypothetical protein LTR15_008883 [Elasticomyces elasticus]
MFRLSKPLEHRARIVFKRVVTFYQTFIIVATLVGGLALTTLDFDEFHPATSPILLGAEGLLCSSGITAVVAVLLATMLLFRYKNFDKPTRLDLAIAWSPLVLLDLGIVELVVGLVMWYGGKSTGWRTAAMAAQLGFFMSGATVMAVWMWCTMSVPGGLGAHDAPIAVAQHSDEVASKAGEH